MGPVVTRVIVSLPGPVPRDSCLTSYIRQPDSEQLPAGWLVQGWGWWSGWLVQGRGWWSGWLVQGRGWWSSWLVQRRGWPPGWLVQGRGWPHWLVSAEKGWWSGWLVQRGGWPPGWLVQRRVWPPGWLLQAVGQSSVSIHGLAILCSHFSLSGETGVWDVGVGHHTRSTPCADTCQAGARLGTSAASGSWGLLCLGSDVATKQGSPGARGHGGAASKERHVPSSSWARLP